MAGEIFINNDLALGFATKPRYQSHSASAAADGIHSDRRRYLSGLRAVRNLDGRKIEYNLLDNKCWVCCRFHIVEYFSGKLTANITRRIVD